MSNWNYENGTFVFRPIQSITRRRSDSVSTTHTHVDDELTSGDSAIEIGTFVQSSGEPSTSIGSFKHSLGIDRAEVHVEPAEHNSRGVVGVVKNTVSGYTLVDTGMCLCWLIKGKRTLPLSGIYSRTINGASSGKVVVLHDPRDDSFIMASSKDDDIELLKMQFSALTQNV